MNKKILLLATSACVLTALVPASVVFGSSKSPARQPEPQQLAQAGTPVAVNEILPKLKGKTQVPIFIPSSIMEYHCIYKLHTHAKHHEQLGRKPKLQYLDKIVAGF